MENILDWIQTVNESINDVVWGPVMIAFFMIVALQFTIRTKFFQVSRVGVWMKQTAGSFFHKKKGPRDKKAISPFQAMTTALAGAIGTGNIVGVATAITLGGPGAIFWMWVAAFFGMMTIFAENVLGVKYRKRNEKGEWVGGPMYYMERGLHQKWMAVLFSCFCVLASLGMGNMTQANSIAGALSEAAGVEPKVTGLILMALIAVIIFGGIKRIVKVTEKIVPFMGLFFMAGGLVVLVLNAKGIPGAFSSIFKGAFTFEAAAGGAGGFMLSRAIKFGIARGVFSNEAGLGSSPIVHSTADAAEPVEQGMWGIFQVFIDTVVMCTMMALCILSTGVAETGKEGVALSAAAFESVFGRFGTVFVSISIVLFAFATIIGWSFYGERSIEYLAGSARPVLVYKAVYAVMAAFGCVMDLNLVWSLSDTFNGLMAVPNLIALLLLSRQVVEMTKDYEKRRLSPRRREIQNRNQIKKRA